jgi:hypothetical protein
MAFPTNPAPPAPRDRNPPSSGLGFAETASPPTDVEFEAQRAAAQAAAAAMRKGSKPPPAPGRSSEPPAPQYASSQPPDRYSSAPPPPGSYAMAPAQMTAAMPSLDPETVADGAPRMLAGFIVSYDTHPLGRSWPIYQGKNRIGRQGSGVELDIELDHPTASSRHALVYASACPGRIKIEDSGSTNGTLINGARLAPGSRQELKDGDRVRFGLLSTIVKIV